MNSSRFANERFESARLGFGCAYVTGGLEKKHNLRLLRTAFDCGIRHFDTAPMYGLGTSEDVLGEAFHAMRDQISIATKVGIPRPDFDWKMQLLRAVSLPVRRYVPGLSRRGAAVLSRSAAVTTEFSPAAVKKSVLESLGRLRTDYVDLLLLHEATANDIDAKLLDTLEEMRQRGMVRRIGIGSELDAIRAIDRKYPDRFEVYQRSWSILDHDATLFRGKRNIFHRSIAGALEVFSQRLATNRRLARYVAQVIPLDISKTDLAKVLIGASISVNPSGITLFGTRRQNRVEEYAKANCDGKNVATGSALVKAYQAYLTESAEIEPTPVASEQQPSAALPRGRMRLGS